MKTKFVSKTFAILAVALASTATLAADPLAGVAGYDPAGGGGIDLTASAVTNGSYTITISGMIGVTPDQLNGLTPYDKKMDGPLKKEVGLYKLPAGTVVYAMGLGRDWGEMSEELPKIELAKAKAKATFGADGKLTFTFTKGEERCRTVNWVAVLPNGDQRAWGGHPEAWVAKNVNGSPRTAWCFKGDAVVQMDRPTKLALAGKK